MQQLLISKNSSFTGKHTHLIPPATACSSMVSRIFGAITTVSHNTFSSPLKETYGQSVILVSPNLPAPQQRFSDSLSSLWIRLCGFSSKQNPATFIMLWLTLLPRTLFSRLIQANDALIFHFFGLPNNTPLYGHTILYLSTGWALGAMSTFCLLWIDW